ncbi:lipopolysaccharide biosynthesis protein [Sphingomonas crocodyli]|uniref:lipopolysaccharide biosynthesis protein n=1 Tax=Sphingomonas crocodyli TaxID=1979270 RepID=UPI001F0C81F3|nr:lipopolysaccharide biosynthesis protein [Sphingomonas crocodyli]
MPPADDTTPDIMSAPPQSGVRRVIANLLHLLGGKAVAGIVSVIYLIIVTHSLGARDYGVLILVNAYAVFMGSVVAFSGYHGVVRYGSQALEAGDIDGMARIVRFMAVVEVAFGVVALVLAALIVPFVGPRMGWSDDAMMLAIPYSLAVLATVRATPQGILQIAGRFDLIGLHQAISPMVRLIGAAIVWALGGGLAGFITVWLIASLVEGVAMWWLGMIAWEKLAEGRRLTGPWRGVLRERGGFGRFIMLTNFDITLRELAPNLAPLTVGWVLGPTAAGLLGLAQRASALLQQPATLLSQASYAVLADQVAKRQFGLLRHTVWRSAAIAGAVAVPIVAVLGLLGDRLLILLGGQSFTGGTTLLILVAIGRLAALAATPIAAGLTALGHPQRSMAVALITNLALYPALPALLWWIGVDGAGWHGLIQNAVALVIVALFFAHDVKRAT